MEGTSVSGDLVSTESLGNAYFRLTAREMRAERLVGERSWKGALEF